MRRTQGSMLCPSCNKLISVSAEKCPYCGAARPGLWGFGPAISGALRRFDPVAGIFVACIALFALSLLLNLRAAVSAPGGFLDLLAPDGRLLYAMGATAPTAGRLSVITAIYLHGSLLHLLFNLLWVRNLAPEVQRAFGPGRFFLIWTFAGALGFAISNLFPHMSVGASGSIFGLMAALIVYGRAIGHSMMTRQIWQYAIVLGILGFLLPGVDNFAHVGGFAGGWIAATAFKRGIGQPAGRGVTYATLAVIALTAFAFLLNVDDVGSYLVRLYGRGMR